MHYLKSYFRVGAPSFSTVGAPFRPYRDVFKRVLDVGLVLALAPVALPLVCGLALLVKLDGGPAFYSQLRVGQGGRTFRFWKLRSMVRDAERVLATHLGADSDAARAWAVHQKLPHDPRVTPIGRILRKSSLDELPQLWNVLRGDMSLVGPRPFLPEQAAVYAGTSYFALRPGLTGLWQVSGRNLCSFAQRAQLDEIYARRVSLGGDLWILLRTFSAVARGTGC